MYRIQYQFSELSEVANMTHQLEVALGRYDDKTYDGDIIDGFFPILQKFMKHMNVIEYVEEKGEERIIFTTFRGSGNPEPGVEMWVNELGMGM